MNEKQRVTVFQVIQAHLKVLNSYTFVTIVQLQGPQWPSG